MCPPAPSPERVHVHSSVNLHPGGQGSSCDALCTPFLRGNLLLALLPLLWAEGTGLALLSVQTGSRCWLLLASSAAYPRLSSPPDFCFHRPGPAVWCLPGRGGDAEHGRRRLFASREGCSLGGSCAGSGGWDGKRERGYRRPSSGAGNRIEDGRQLCSPTRLEGRERERNNIQCLQPCLAHTLTSPP